MTPTTVTDPTSVADIPFGVSPEPYNTSPMVPLSPFSSSSSELPNSTVLPASFQTLVILKFNCKKNYLLIYVFLYFLIL